MPNAGVLLVQSEYIGMLMNPEYEKQIETTCNIGNPIINLNKPWSNYTTQWYIYSDFGNRLLIGFATLRCIMKQNDATKKSQSLPVPSPHHVFCSLFLIMCSTARIITHWKAVLNINGAKSAKWSKWWLPSLSDYFSFSQRIGLPIL